MYPLAACRPKMVQGGVVAPVYKLQYDTYSLVGLSDNDEILAFPNAGTLGAAADLAKHTTGPLYKTGGPNGQPYMAFTSDFLVSSAFTLQAQPVRIFAVAKFNATGTKVVFSGIANDSGLIALLSDNIIIFAYAGVPLYGSGNDDAWHVFEIVANGASSQYILDGVEIVAGDAGTNGINGLTFGSNYDFSDPLTGQMASYRVIQGSAALNEAVATAARTDLQTIYDL